MSLKVLISYEDAVRALAMYLAIGGPPSVTEYNKARSILWGCLSDEERTKRVLR